MARKTTTLEVTFGKTKTVLPLDRGTTLKRLVLKAGDIKKGINFLDFKSPTSDAWGLKSLQLIKP